MSTKERFPLYKFDKSFLWNRMSYRMFDHISSSDSSCLLRRSVLVKIRKSVKILLQPNPQSLCKGSNCLRLIASLGQPRDSSSECSISREHTFLCSRFFSQVKVLPKLEIVAARNAIEGRTHGAPGLSQQQFCSDWRFSFPQLLRDEMAVCS